MVQGAAASALRNFGDQRGVNDRTDCNTRSCEVGRARLPQRPLGSEHRALVSSPGVSKRLARLCNAAAYAPDSDQLALSSANHPLTALCLRTLRPWRSRGRCGRISSQVFAPLQSTTLVELCRRPANCNSTNFPDMELGTSASVLLNGDVACHSAGVQAC